MATTLNQQDLASVVRQIPAYVRNTMRTHGLVLAGGFVRDCVARNKPSDLDLFGPHRNGLMAAAEDMAKAIGSRLHITDNAVTLLAFPRMPVQLITRWRYTDPAVLLADLDFSVCQAAVWAGPKLWESMVTPEFYPDLAARRLRYTAPTRDEEAGGSMMRVRKFLARGYFIGADDLAAVMVRVTSRVRGWDGLDDAERTRVLTGLLREVDPLTIHDRVDLDAGDTLAGVDRAFDAFDLRGGSDGLS